MSGHLDHELARIVTDICVFSKRPDDYHLLLIKRGTEPYKGRWALPGGHVDKDETFDQAAVRELEEETGVSGVSLERITVWDTPGRDPRYRSISLSYGGIVGMVDATGADDAEEAKWWPIQGLPELAFDHYDIVSSALDWLRAKED